MKLTLIVPCYNEEGNILPLYNKVKETFEEKITDYEFVFINDGSTDRTGAILAALVKTADIPMKVVNFSRNFGKESGIYAGLHYADGEYICVMDGDLQQNPSFLLEMTGYLDDHPDCDCVAAYQENRSESPALIFFKDGFYKIINKISDTEFVMGASDFRTFRRNVAETILNMPEYHRFSKGIFSWVGFNTHYIPYQADDRLTGTTKWSFLKLWKYAFEGILAFSTKPLELPFWGGLGLTGIGLLRTAVAAAKKDDSGKTNGLIALIGGLNMAATGIAGIYLSKTYVQSKGRPVYIAKSVLTNRK
ncbi:MAG: glycosyltransferase family 2 protein [Acutalibacteraceae bacterium]|nr:glycosyltransferase family 2 protein [Acutalibacteraceae bacterium]